MQKIIESIPNFSVSEGPVLEGLISLAKSFSGVTLLDASPDTSHNRTVVTLLGDYAGMKEAIVSLVKYAIENIDLTTHKGEHPRMGAVDVIPFVPIKNATMEECIGLSREVAERVSQLGLPVFLYEESAMAVHGKSTTRANLATLRKGEFEGMEEKIKEEKFKPDYGTELHKTAGIVAIGARMPLVAFNVNLSTSNVELANKIAKIVRGAGGGLKYVKAIGIALNEHTAQVSMNLTNYEKTPIYRALELIKIEAARYGITVTGTELIGLAPMDALIDSAVYYMQIENYERDAILERRL